jgi:hypothetical protein
VPGAPSPILTAAISTPQMAVRAAALHRRNMERHGTPLPAVTTSLTGLIRAGAKQTADRVDSWLIL